MNARTSTFWTELSGRGLARQLRLAIAALAVVGLLFIATDPSPELETIRVVDAATARDASDGDLQPRFGAPHGDPASDAESL